MPTPTFNFQRILKTLAVHGVEFIIVGGVGAVLQGAPIVTFDLDIVHDRTPENLTRLLAALQELDAHYREAGHRRIQPQLSHLESSGHQLLMTRDGPLDLLGTTTGERGYPDLLAHSTEAMIGADLKARILDLPTLILLKEEAGRDKDRAVLPILRRTLEEKGKR